MLTRKTACWSRNEKLRLLLMIPPMEVPWLGSRLLARFASCYPPGESSSNKTYTIANFSSRGVINSYGVYQTYYQSHFLSHQSQSNIAWIGSLQSGILLIVCLFVGPVYDAGYTTLLMFAGTMCLVVGMIISSFCSQYWHLLLAQGLAVGVGGGCLYLPGVSIISQYFKRRRGYVG